MRQKLWRFAVPSSMVRTASAPEARRYFIHSDNYVYQGSRQPRGPRNPILVSPALKLDRIPPTALRRHLTGSTATGSVPSPTTFHLTGEQSDAS